MNEGEVSAVMRKHIGTVMLTTRLKRGVKSQNTERQRGSRSEL